MDAIQEFMMQHQITGWLICSVTLSACAALAYWPELRGRELSWKRWTMFFGGLMGGIAAFVAHLESFHYQ